LIKWLLLIDIDKYVHFNHQIKYCPIDYSTICLVDIPWKNTTAYSLPLNRFTKLLMKIKMGTVI